MPTGEHYQVCIHCGTRFGYDWQAMRRLQRLSQQQDLLLTSSPLMVQKHTNLRWTSRERRVRCQLPVFYRLSEAHPWLCGQIYNVSRSGVLFRVPHSIRTKSVLELILEEPREMTGLQSAQVVCTAVVLRTIPLDGQRQWLLGCARLDYESRVNLRAA